MRLEEASKFCNDFFRRWLGGGNVGLPDTNAAFRVKVYNDEMRGVLLQQHEQPQSILIHNFYISIKSFVTQTHRSTHSTTMSSPASNTSSRASSVTATPERPQLSKQTHSFGSATIAALKKPFQGWSKELLRARDDDDDDYNFASGMRRGCDPRSYRNDC
jgi:hypothetical protein